VDCRDSSAPSLQVPTCPAFRFHIQAAARIDSLRCWNIIASRPYAITDIGSDSSEAFEKAVWTAKEIAAQFFLRRPGKSPYAPLWESIARWAEWARDESTWVERELSKNTTIRYRDATPFKQAFVQDLLSVLTSDELASAIQFLASKKVDFAWIGAVRAAIDASITPSLRAS
jgi:hypothetical protein